MPTTINVNAAGYDLDAGGVTGSIVSGTLFLGHASNLGGQLRAKAITDTPAIIAQAYSGTANGFEVWDSLGNVVAEISKTGAATFDGQLSVDVTTDYPIKLKRSGTIAAYIGFDGFRDLQVFDSSGLVVVKIDTTTAGKAATFGGAIKQGIASGSSDPTTGDYASGTGGWWKSTGANEIRFWYNDGGVMKKSGALT